MSSLCLLFNFLVIYSFFNIPECSRRLMSNVIFIIMALCDSYNAFTMALTYAYLALVQSSHEASHIDDIRDFFIDHSRFLSVMTLLVLSAERFVATRFPFVYRSHITINKVVTISFGTFLLSSVPAILLVSYIKSLKDDDERFITRYVFTLEAISIAAVLSALVLLSLSYVEIRKNSGIEKKLDQDKEKEFETTAAEEKQVNEDGVVLILLIMSMLYTVTYIPQAVYSMIFDRARGNLSVLSNEFHLVMARGSYNYKQYTKTQKNTQ